jgi:SRSO17 transposase
MAQHKTASRERFEAYLEQLGTVVGHADRREPLRAYLMGLLMPGERKSVEPMATKIDPRHVRSRHQSMHHFVADAPWDEKEMLTAAREYVLPQMERHAPVQAWVVDDTGMPKKGRHSVGVARQYCGAVGKQENCQVAVSVSLANEVMSLPCEYRLYLPESWTKERRRCQEAGVPPEVNFRTKWEFALEALDRMLADALPRAPVVADAGYGVVTEFREELTARGLSYAVGITGDVTVWPPGMEALPPGRWTGRGRKPTLLRRDSHHQPVSVKALAKQLPAKAWRTVRWREGTRGLMKSRFAAVRVRAAHRDHWRSRLREPEWLLVEWPKGEAEPTKYWLSTVPEDVTIEDIVRLVKIRWRIERDYQEMKDELGLDHYEGRGWRGFHHHGALCIAAYAFLIAERARLSPPAPLAFLYKDVRVPKGFRPRGSPRTP